MLIIHICAGMVLTNIRIWKDFIISRDSGLVTTEAAKFKPKTIQFVKNITKETKEKISQDIQEIKSEDTGCENDSDKTITEKEKVSDLRRK